MHDTIATGWRTSLPRSYPFGFLLSGHSEWRPWQRGTLVATTRDLVGRRAVRKLRDRGDGTRTRRSV